MYYCIAEILKGYIIYDYSMSHINKEKFYYLYYVQETSALLIGEKTKKNPLSEKLIVKCFKLIRFIFF